MFLLIKSRSSGLLFWILEKWHITFLWDTVRVKSFQSLLIIHWFYVLAKWWLNSTRYQTRHLSNTNSYSIMQFVTLWISGAFLTAGVLAAGLISFKRGNSQLGQQLMRARVLVQGGTVALMVGSAYYYGDNFKRAAWLTSKRRLWTSSFACHELISAVKWGSISLIGGNSFHGCHCHHTGKERRGK